MTRILILIAALGVLASCAQYQEPQANCFTFLRCRRTGSRRHRLHFHPNERAGGLTLQSSLAHILAWSLLPRSRLGPRCADR